MLFAALGRASHEEGSAVTGTLEVAAPFLVAAAVGWVAARAWRRPAAPVTGLVVWGTTVVGGMLLRGLVFDRGTAPSFIVVTAIVLGLLMLGWRVVIDQARRRRSPRRA